MTVIDTLGNLQTVQGLVGELVSAVREQEGWVLLRERFSPDARLAREIAEADSNWWAKMWLQLGDNMRRMTAEEQATAFDRMTSDLEGATILANYITDAHREPLKSRRELLAHAAAGLVDLGLSIPELARIWRVLRELDAADIMVLYGLWLLPNRDGVSERRHNVWINSGAEALLACGAVRTVFRQPPPGLPSDQLEITTTGRLLLSGVRSYLAIKPLPETPGHESASGFRPELEARALLAAIPNVDTLRSYQNKRFGMFVQYSPPNVAAGASPRGRAQLLFRQFSPEHAATLPLSKRDIPHGTPVDDLWFEQVSPGDTEGSKTAFLMGPHDVLRFLAYDLFAAWA